MHLVCSSDNLVPLYSMWHSSSLFLFQFYLLWAFPFFFLFCLILLSSFCSCNHCITFFSTILFLFLLDFLFGLVLGSLFTAHVIQSPKCHSLSDALAITHVISFLPGIFLLIFFLAGMIFLLFFSNFGIHFSFELVLICNDVIGDC